MSSISTLARKSLEANRSRTTLTILTIIMTTCLLTCIGILSYSIRQNLIEKIVEQTGSIHAEYKNVTDKQVDILKNNVDVMDSVEVIGSDIRIDDKRFGSISPSIQYIDNVKMAGLILEEGSLPITDNEIVLESWVLKRLGINPQLGKKISLSCQLGGRSSNQGSRDIEFNLSGILKDSLYTKNWNVTLALVSKNFILENTANKDVLMHSLSVRLKNRMNISEAAIKLGHIIGVKDEDIKINDRYIQALAGDISTVLPYMLVGIVVVFAAAIVIYNIFYISVTQRIRQFGLISAVGGTKSQLQKVILTEGLLLSFIGIPAGLLIGYGLSRFIIPMFSLDGLIISTTPLIFTGAAIISLISIIIAINKPSRLASAVSPVEAIRYSGSELASRKGRRKGKQEVDIGRLAYLNLWRNRKRTMITLLSLIMSGVLFIVISTILASMNLKNLTDIFTTGDFQLTSNNIRLDDGSDPLNRELTDTIRSLEGVSTLDNVMYEMLYMDYSEDSVYVPLPPEAKGIELNCSFYGYGDGFITKQLENMTEGEATLEDLKNENTVLILADDNGTSPYKPGEKIRLKKYNPDKTFKELELTVLGTVGRNITWMGSSGFGPTFIAHQNTFNHLELDKRIDRICINAGPESYDRIKSVLESITGNSTGITYMSQKETNEEFARQLAGIKLAAMCLVGIIGIVGILNLVNTMITSILSRKKEIGMLQAVGLTGKQLGKMLQLEGAYYSVTSAIVSVTLGTGLGYIFYTLFKRNATYAQYVFPIWQVLFILVTYTLVQAAITFTVGRSLGNETIIDRIRLNE